MAEVTVVIGHRGYGQVLGFFASKNKVSAPREMVKEFHDEGYVSFEKVNEFQLKRFGLYFK